MTTDTTTETPPAETLTDDSNPAAEALPEDTGAHTPVAGGAMSTRPLMVAAAIPSVLSLAWTAWSIADMIPAPWPVALAAGVALDVALVAAVALAWMAPSITRGAQVASWFIAALAAAAIGVHSFEITPALTLLAAVPLVAKALWHLALVAKGQAEAARRTAEQAQQAKADRLSVELTEDEQAAIADLERQAAFTEKKAAAQRKLDAAHSEAEHAAKLADIEREAAEQMKRDEATAKIHVRRHELAQQIDLAAPVTAPARQQLPRVPDDASSLTPRGGAEAGFGAAFAATPAPAPATGATAADLGVPQGATPTATAGATPSSAPAAPAAPETEPVPAERTWPRPPSPEQGRRQLVEYAQWRLDQGQVPSIRDAAKRMTTSPRSVSRYRESLREQGGAYAELMEKFRTQ